MSVSPGFKAAINNYLQAAASKDSLFAETLKKVNKNIDECCTYIINEVQKLHKSKAIAMADEEVFAMAVHYYDEDSIVVGAPVRAAANHSSDSTKEKMVKAIAERDHTTPAQKPVKKSTVKVIENQVSMF
ncbi:PcfK-like family protein [Mucilaginibacter sp. SP1R1]|uniref:PcfK-like family protein n=1 Tax=Mucilaginibacter sp. SP1R1 TaxID=2723091 RepID=UPI0016105B8B|nr:Cas9 inhibitor AcrIIA9 family protein [Mucilaginibacter sp. SP1R1]MBB6149444.1 hypothetical protein [Mucilaginibacter sp. SP1R1]